MRFATFIAGGLVGAAMVYMFNSEARKKLMFSMNSVRGMSPFNQRSQAGSMSTKKHQMNSNDAQTDIEALSKFRKMISEDPEIKKSIQEIVGKEAVQSKDSEARASHL